MSLRPITGFVLAATSVIFAACGGAGTPDAVKTATSFEKPNPDQYRPAAAGPLPLEKGSAKLAAVVAIRSAQVNRLALLPEATGPVGQSLAEFWSASRGVRLRDAEGVDLRQVTDAAILSIIKPANGQCLLLFAAPDDSVREVYLDLPLPGGDVIRFSTNRSEWRVADFDSKEVTPPTAASKPTPKGFPAVVPVDTSDILGVWTRVSVTTSVVNPPKLPAEMVSVEITKSELIADGKTRWAYSLDSTTMPATLTLSDQAGKTVSISLIQKDRDGRLQLAFGGQTSPKDVAIGPGNALAVFTFVRSR